MSLFRSENPNLGPSTTINETATTPTSLNAVTTFDHTPFGARVITYPLRAADTTGWIYVASNALRVAKVVFITQVVANSTQTVSITKVPYAIWSVGAVNPNGTGSVSLTAAATPVGSGATANTPAISALTTTTADLLLAPGDMIGYTASGALTSLVGGNIEITLVKQ